MTTAPVKPLYGSPCNSCGLCCVMEQCPLSEAVFGTQALCPALEALPTGGYGCGLIARPAAYGVGGDWASPVVSEAFAVILGAGQGCDGVLTDADRALSVHFDADIRPRAEAAYAAASPEARALIDRLSPMRNPT